MLADLRDMLSVCLAEGFFLPCKYSKSSIDFAIITSISERQYYSVVDVSCAGSLGSCVFALQVWMAKSAFFDRRMFHYVNMKVKVHKIAGLSCFQLKGYWRSPPDHPWLNKYFRLIDFVCRSQFISWNGLKFEQCKVLIIKALTHAEECVIHIVIFVLAVKNRPWEAKARSPKCQVMRTLKFVPWRC